MASTGSPVKGADFAPKRSGITAPSPATKQSCTAIGSQIVPTATPSAPRADQLAQETVASPAVPPPGLSQTSAMTTGPAGAAIARATASRLVHHRHHVPPAVGEKLASQPLGQRRPVLRRAVGDGDHLRPHLRHVAGHEAVDRRQRQHLRIVPLDRQHPVDEPPHRLRARSGRRRSSGSRRPTSPACSRPSSVSTAIRQRSSARSTKSVCGNSLNTVKKSAAATRFAVRWLCGSSSAQTSTSGPTISRTRASRSPSGSS